MRLASHARKPGLAPKVSGYVVNASFTDNRHVKAGEVLAHIDERDYKIALDPIRLFDRCRACQTCQGPPALTLSGSAEPGADGCEIDGCAPPPTRTKGAQKAGCASKSWPLSIIASIERRKA
jgi:hypothetical protein